MRILFVSGAPMLPQIFGGSQRTTDELIRALLEKGHDVALTAGLVGLGWLSWRGRILMKLTGRGAIKDTQLGYRVWRSWFPWQTAPEVVAAFSPDVAVICCDRAALNAHALRACGVPTLFSFENVEFAEEGGDLTGLDPIYGVANSRFTADRYNGVYGAESVVIHPLIEPGRYRTETDRSRVTFINPHPTKGLDIVFGVAEALPHIPFLMIGGWPLPPDDQTKLETRVANSPNIEFRPPASDMRTVYRNTRILLAPSEWDEGYGRVVTEAQFSGIPVVASDRGGLPEAVGEGGFVLKHDSSVADWAAAIERLWSDPLLYEQVGQAARAHASREAVDPTYQLDQWEQALTRIVEHGRI